LAGRKKYAVSVKKFFVRIVKSVNYTPPSIYKTMSLLLTSLLVVPKQE